jgi:hypothetical protein
VLGIVASEQPEQEALELDLDALVRADARRILLAALKAELVEYITHHADHRDCVKGCRLLSVGSLVRPGTLIAIAAAQHPGVAPAAGQPWPLRRSEIEAFATDGLTAVRVERVVANP